MRARCRLGFERRVDAAIYRSASKAEVGTQSSEHGVVATGKHVDLSGCLFVERHVRLSRTPKSKLSDLRAGFHKLELGLVPDDEKRAYIRRLAVRVSHINQICPKDAAKYQALLQALKTTA